MISAKFHSNFESFFSFCILAVALFPSNNSFTTLVFSVVNSYSAIRLVR